MNELRTLKRNLGNPEDQVFTQFYGFQTFYDFADLVSPSLTAVSTGTYSYPITTSLFIEPSKSSYTNIVWVDSDGNILNSTAIILLSAAVSPLSSSTLPFFPSPNPNVKYAYSPWNRPASNQSL